METEVSIYSLRVRAINQNAVEPLAKTRPLRDVAQTINPGTLREKRVQEL